MNAIDTCSEPACLLRREDVDSRFIAELVVRLLAGEDVSAELASSPTITSSPRCVECALRVMSGRLPLPTVEEVEGLVDAGKASHRRAERRRRREQRSIP